MPRAASKAQNMLREGQAKYAARIQVPRRDDSAFNLRLHADRAVITSILAQLGYGWEVFAKVLGPQGNLRIQRIAPYPQIRRAVYLEARKSLSADRIARAVVLNRSTVITSLGRAGVQSV